MTPDQITQLRTLIIEMRERLQLLYEGELKIESLADKALALLPCPTCNGDEQILLPRKDTPGVDWEPCPTCKSTEKVNDERMGSDGVGFIYKKDISCPDCQS